MFVNNMAQLVGSIEISLAVYLNFNNVYRITDGQIKD